LSVQAISALPGSSYVPDLQDGTSGQEQWDLHPILALPVSYIHVPGLAFDWECFVNVWGQPWSSEMVAPYPWHVLKMWWNCINWLHSMWDIVISWSDFGFTGQNLSLA
jgi:hypothetical protein